MDSSSVETIEEDIKSIADHPFAKAAGVERSVQSAIQWLCYADHEWLLIFDNADGDPNTISKYVPPGIRGNILFTSRNPMMRHHVSSNNGHVEVDAMAEEQAISLLLQSAMLDESSTDLIALSRTIVEELCCLPLAVDQAGAAIASGLCNIYNYRELYDKSRNELLAHSSFNGASNYGRAVNTTFELSYKAIRDCTFGTSDRMTSRTAEIAIFILETFAFLHNENISEDIIKRAAEAPFEIDTTPQLQCGQPMANKQSLRELISPELLRCHDSGEWDPLVFREGIQILCSFALVKPNPSTNSYYVHPLIHSWSRHRMTNEDKQKKWFLTSSLLAHSFSLNPEDRVFRRSLIPHLIFCKSHKTTSYMDNQFFKFGYAFLENGLYNEGEESMVQILEPKKRILGAEHPETLEALNNLAVTYCQQERADKAKELLLQVVQSSKRVLGEEHPLTLTIMTNLALIYSQQGHRKETEELQLQVMQSSKKVYGEEHPRTLRAMDTLALIYKTQGHTNAAEQLQIQAIELSKRVLGEEHPDTLSFMCNLALTRRQCGDMKEAEHLLLQVVESWKRVLGEKHPQTLETTYELVATYVKQGRREEADKLRLQINPIVAALLGE